MSTMTDADIHAFPAPGAERGRRRGDASRSPRRAWPWVVLAMAVLFVAAVVGSVLVLGQSLDQALGGLDIRVDGEHVLTLPKGEAAWWAVAAGVLAGMVLLVVVPLALLLALLIAVLVLAALVVVVLAVGALALSPLWGLALLLWLALREPRAGQAASPGTTMASTGPQTGPAPHEA